MTRLGVLLSLMLTYSPLLFAGDWAVEISMAREQWLPAEPIAATLDFFNVSGEEAPLYSGSFFLDDPSTTCVDRARGVVDPPAATDSVESATSDGIPGHAPGTHRRIEVRITRVCNLEVGNLERIYGPHRFCYRPPIDGPDICVDFQVLRPTAADAEALKRFPNELRDVVTDASKVPEAILKDYPTSIYAGYILARQLSPLPGIGDDPMDRVVQLTDAGFFHRFPTTHDRSRDALEGARLDMEKTVRIGARLRRDFLDAHPGFQLRTDLEQQLGDLELVLGNYDRAYESWTWVADHATGNQASWAEGKAQAMETQDLISLRAKTDE